MLKLWTSKITEKFVLQKVSTNINLVCKELTNLKLTKATGLTARLLKDPAPIIAYSVT